MAPPDVSASEQEEEVAQALPRAAWDGSEVTQADIDHLVSSRRIPAGVQCRNPGDEITPAPQSGEFVVFSAHFDRGFGLPASNFFRQFLDNYHLQPHHLPANAFTQLSAYVSFMEGYAGLWPTVEAWAKFFQFRRQDLPNKGLPAAEK